MAEKICFEITDPFFFKKKMLNWASRFSIFCYLDGNGYPASNAFPVMLAADARRSVSLSSGSAFDSLRFFFDQRPSYLFGHLGFSLMKETEAVEGIQASTTDFGDGFFFEPEILLSLEENKLTIQSDRSAIDIYQEILNSENIASNSERNIDIRPFMSRDEYVTAVSQVQEHIRQGDCYELNYCQAFRADGVSVDPVKTFIRLMDISPNPFSALYKLNDRYCICASPERFLKKSGKKVVSQPMKGTAPRFENQADDERSRQELKESSKELSENVMIVDLVRNDLSKCCVAGSVEVEELFGIYSFPLVHQMVSTVSGEMKDEVHWCDLLRSCFPMGSMTGAPKKRVLELTSLYEKTGRGLFSGSIGYIDPAGDFDLNVVIRSIFYDQSKGELSYQTGGGITFYSDPVNEYKETMLKAAAMSRALSVD